MQYQAHEVYHAFNAYQNFQFNTPEIWTAGVGFDLQIKTLPKLSPQQHAMNRRKQKQGSLVRCARLTQLLELAVSSQLGALLASTLFIIELLRIV